MDKELEMLEALEKLLEGYSKGMAGRSYYDTIKRALTELQAIKESNPSEALECLERVSELQYIDHWESREKEIKTIENALLKAQEQDFNNKNIVIPFFNELIDLFETNDIDEMLDKIKEQEKVLEIIKNKDVDMYSLRRCKTVEEYNSKFAIDEYQELTQEEFDLLKRWCERCE